MVNKTDVLVKLVLVLFISLLSFAIGTYVGRKYSDNQHKMASLEPSKLKQDNSGEGHSSEGHREVASESADGASKGKGPESLTDEEIAKLAEEFVTDGKETTPEVKEHGANEPKAKDHATKEHAVVERPHDANHEIPVMEVAPSSHAKTIAPTNKVAPTSKIAKSQTTTEPQQRIPSSIPKDVAQYSVGKFTVQVASFGNKDEAEKKSSELQGKGYKAFVVPAQVKGKNWYRVSVGLFASEKEAKEYRTEFLTHGYVETALVQKIAN